MKISRRFAWTGLILFGVSLLLLLQWKLEIHWGLPAIAQSAPSRSLNVLPSTIISNEPSLETNMLNTKNIFREEFRREALNIGQPDQNPEKTEARLDEMAHALSSENMNEIRILLFESSSEGDQIALALELLGRTSQPEAQNILTKYLLEGPSSSPRELVTFQLLALESLILQSDKNKNPEYLNIVRNQTEDSVISRRADQALKALNGQAKSTAETDAIGLEKLLESKNTH